MAVYEHLPIYKKLMELTVFVEQTVSHFSRYYKYTLGSELRSMCHEALGLVVEANTAPALKSGVRQAGEETGGSARNAAGIGVTRRDVLLKLRNLLERIKIHLMLAREVRAFNNKNSFVQATEIVVELCRQNEGWIKRTARGMTRGPRGPESPP
jgi:hypothetical protein